MNQQYVRVQFRPKGSGDDQWKHFCWCKTKENAETLVKRANEGAIAAEYRVKPLDE